MCGIFGFALRKPINVKKVFELLKKLEIHQYPQEKTPVGGYGAGIACMNTDGRIVLKKVGKVNGSPVANLSEIAHFSNVSVLVAHVRMPSENFMKTANFSQTAQPYITSCFHSLNLVSIHNGYLKNYLKIREELGAEHIFESEEVELIDSEVIPHYFEQLLEEKGKTSEALDALFAGLEGSNAIGLLQVARNGTFLHLIHKGKTRGLTVWINSEREVVFCSRREPLVEVFGDMLTADKFEEKVFIPYREDASLKLTFPLTFR